MRHWKIAVIIPVYNLEDVISDTLSSVTSQTYDNIDIVVVDDGSTDKSVSIVKKIMSEDFRVRLIEKSNGGVSSARNLGIGLVGNADYYTFIDGDDYIAPSYIENLLGDLTRSGADIVCSVPKAVKVIADTNKLLGVIDSDDSITVLNSESATTELLYDGLIKNHVCGKMYSRHLIDVGTFDESIAAGEDMEYVFRILRACKKVAVTNRRQYFYVKRSGSAMNSGFSEKRASSLDAAVKMADTKDLGSEEARAVKVKLFTEAFSVAALSYPHRVAYSSIYRRARSIARRTRLEVLINPNAKISQKIYAMVSLVNFRLASHMARR